MKEKLLHDTLRSLHIECGLDTELVIGGSGEVRGGREERLRVSGHWTRMVTGEWLVLGLALTSGLEPVTNISLQVVSDQDCHLDYQWRLLTWRCPGILHSSTSMAASQSSVAAASLSLSSCISPQPVTLHAGVSYRCGDSTDFVTETIRIVLPTNFISNIPRLDFSNRDTEQSLIALHMTGVCERVKSFTKMGSLNNLGDLMENHRFLYNQNICSHVYIEPDHPLHNSVVKTEPESSQSCEVSITAKSHLQAIFVIRLLRSLLPLDAYFTKV